jgi:hypothetical protein
MKMQKASPMNASAFKRLNARFLSQLCIVTVVFSGRLNFTVAKIAVSQKDDLVLFDCRTARKVVQLFSILHKKKFSMEALALERQICSL